MRITKAERNVAADFCHTLAVELESHLANGSAFIYLNGSDGTDDNAPDYAVKIRLRILTRLITALESRSERLSNPPIRRRRKKSK